MPANVPHLLAMLEPGKRFVAAVLVADDNQRLQGVVHIRDLMRAKVI